LLTKLKERLQYLLVGAAKVAHDAGLTPNQVSQLGFIAAIVSAGLYWSSQFYNILLVGAAVLLLTSGFLDVVDGALARAYGQTTLLGGFLDSLLDRYADSFVLIGVIMGWLATDSEPWLFVGFAALMGSLLVSYTRARAEAAGVRMETVGLAERAERIIIVVAASFLTLLWRDALRWSVLLLALLTNLTVLQRAIYFRKASHKKEASATPVV
jgi:archaetidylinositol phosphate synthase